MKPEGVLDRKQAAADLNPVNHAVNAEEAERNLSEFEAKWPKYPAMRECGVSNGAGD